MTTPDTKNAKYWQEKLTELNRTQLDVVRATAAKWQGSISALLGVFGTVAFATGATALEKLPAGTATHAKQAISIAAALALTALVTVSYAAQGLPRKRDNAGWPWLEQQSRQQAGRALVALRISQGLALAATGIVLAGSVVLLWKSEAKPADKPAAALVRTADGTVVCASLILTDGVVAARLANGSTVRLDSRTQVVGTVAACPK